VTGNPGGRLPRRSGPVLAEPVETDDRRARPDPGAHQTRIDHGTHSTAASSDSACIAPSIPGVLVAVAACSSGGGGSASRSTRSSGRSTSTTTVASTTTPVLEGEVTVGRDVQYGENRSYGNDPIRSRQSIKSPEGGGTAPGGGRWSLRDVWEVGHCPGRDPGGGLVTASDDAVTIGAREADRASSLTRRPHGRDRRVRSRNIFARRQSS
jgi:hypothetical protein